MIDAEQRTGHFYNNLAGTENDLNHVMSISSTQVNDSHLSPPETLQSRRASLQ